jgi:hypothetical protein
VADWLSYLFEIDSKLAGLDASISKLLKADVAIKDTTTALKGMTSAEEAAKDELGRLQAKLSALKAPGEIKRLTKEIADFGKPAKETFKGLGATVDDARGRMSQFFQFTGALLAVQALGGVVHAIERLGHAVMDVLNVAGAEERTNLAFQLSLGAEGAKEVLGWIERIAPRTEFTKDQLEGWSSQLLNAGVAMKDIDKFMAAGLDIASRSTNPLESMATAIGALERAELTGNIEGRALRALKIPMAQLAELDKFKGLSEKQIRKKLESTTITRDEMLSLIAGPDKMLGDLGIQAGDTLNAKLKNVKNLPEMFFEKFADSPGFETFKGKLDEIFAALDPNGPKGAKLFAALERVFMKLVDIVAKFDFTKAAATLERVVVLLEKAAKIMDVADDVASFISPVRLGLKVKGMIEDRFGDSVGDGLKGGIESGSDKVAGASEKLANTAADAATKTLDIHSPSGVFEDIGEMTGAGFLRGMERSQRAVEAALGGAFAVPSGRAASGLGGRVEISFGDLTVQITGTGEPAKDGAAAADALMGRLRGQLVELFEQVAVEQGSG